MDHFLVGAIAHPDRVKAVDVTVVPPIRLESDGYLFVTQPGPRCWMGHDFKVENKVENKTSKDEKAKQWLIEHGKVEEADLEWVTVWDGSCLTALGTRFKPFRNDVRQKHIIHSGEGVTFEMFRAWRDAKCPPFDVFRSQWQAKSTGKAGNSKEVEI